MSSRGSSTKAKPKEPLSLKGKRILIVEDSPVVGPFTADLLGELGCKVVGPAPNMAMGRALIDSERIDAAVMDVHIRGERVFPLCETLAAKGVPFVLTSGYADWNMPEKWRDKPRLQKPYTLDQIGDALKRLLSASA
jgi:DNA-binding NtrC family response regulator